MATQPIFVDCWLDFFDKIAEVRGKTYRQHYENLLEHPNSSVSQHALARAEHALRKAPTCFDDEDFRGFQHKIEEDIKKVREKTYRKHYENLLKHPDSSDSQHALARAEEALRKAPTFFKDEDLRELQRKIEEDLSKSPPDESDTPLE